MSDDRKEKQAIGLAYDGVNAPQVIAKGFDELAEEIIAVAKEHGVMVHEDPLLSDSLARLNFGEEIPRDLYIINRLHHLRMAARSSASARGRSHSCMISSMLAPLATSLAARW